MPLTSRSSLPFVTPLNHRGSSPTTRLRCCVLALSGVAVAVPATASALSLPTPPEPAAPIAGPWGRIVTSAVSPPLATATQGCANARLMPTSADMPLVADAIACLVNAQRRAAGLPPLHPSAALHQSAQGHSQSMVAGDYFSHSGPSGRTPEQRMRAAGYQCHRSCSMGENIAWGSGSYATASSIVSLWMSSTEHRDNILRRSFQVQGVGAALGAPARGWPHRNATTVTQDFGGN
jgi:uncharacterized protein YkwD